MARDLHSWMDDDDDRPADGEQKVRKEFDCPECNANNPWDEGFGPGDEVRCTYCGMEFKVYVSDGGRWKYREL